MTVLHVTLLGGLREIAAVPLPAAEAAHSTRSLRRFALELHVPHERQPALDAELQAAAAPDGTYLQGTDAMWRVVDGWTVVAHGLRAGIHRYRVEIEEVDDTAPDTRAMGEGASTEAGKPPAGESADVMQLKLAVLVLPVSDVDRAKSFYEAVGFRLDADHAIDASYRVVHMTPPGSACSILFGTGVTAAAPGSVRGLHLVVSDIEQACRELDARGVVTGGIFHDTSGVFHRSTDEKRVEGPDPQRRDYHSYAEFSDPDGNEWVLQEVPARA
jgi:catechol 2,3-dioxygenase-like lactoylglutathione lyase family enzyme